MEALPYKEVLQLGGLAVVSLGVLYILYVFIKEHRSEMRANREERLAANSWFQSYVNENNHEQTERFKEHTQALIDVSKESANAMNAVAKNIEVNTKVVEKHGELLEKIMTEIKYFNRRLDG